MLRCAEVNTFFSNSTIKKLSWLSFFCCSFSKLLECPHTDITFVIRKTNEHWFSLKGVSYSSLKFLHEGSPNSLIHTQITCSVLVELLGVRHQIEPTFFSAKRLIGCFTYKPLDSCVLAQHSSRNFLNNSTHQRSQTQTFPLPHLF